jgi:hypothetical protein
LFLTAKGADWRSKRVLLRHFHCRFVVHALRVTYKVKRIRRQQHAVGLLAVADWCARAAPAMAQWAVQGQEVGREQDREGASSCKPAAETVAERTHEYWFPSTPGARTAWTPCPDTGSMDPCPDRAVATRRKRVVRDNLLHADPMPSPIYRGVGQNMGALEADNCDEP